jgi:hypothetical protein
VNWPSNCPFVQSLSKDERAVHASIPKKTGQAGHCHAKQDQHERPMSLIYEISVLKLTPMRPGGMAQQYGFSL